MPERRPSPATAPFRASATTCAQVVGIRGLLGQKLGGHRELSEDGVLRTALLPPAAKSGARRRRSGLADPRHAGSRGASRGSGIACATCRTPLAAPLVDDQPDLRRYARCRDAWVAGTPRTRRDRRRRADLRQQMEHADARRSPRPEHPFGTRLSGGDAGSTYPLAYIRRTHIADAPGRRKRPRAAFRRSSTRAIPGRISRVASDGDPQAGHDHVRCRGCR